MTMHSKYYTAGEDLKKGEILFRAPDGTLQVLDTYGDPGDDLSEPIFSPNMTEAEKNAAKAGLGGVLGEK